MEKIKEILISITLSSVIIITIVGIVHLCENAKYKTLNTELLSVIDSLNIELTKRDFAISEFNDNIEINNIKRDSILCYKDSIETELTIANFKLERIRYYNNIAAKNNNIKYLRGWINRVINN